MRCMKIAAMGIVLALAGAGCANWGETEPVLGGGNGGGYQEPDPRMVATIPSRTVEYAAPQESRATRQELATLKADLEVLREDQKQLMQKILILEQAGASKDAQIKELQNLLDSIDKRFADVDKNWRARMTELSTNIDNERASRQKDLDNLRHNVSRELSNTRNQAAAQAAAEGDYISFEVQAGDSLSSIAKAAGISVAELKKINGLKSDRIYVKQKLKIPRR